MAPAAVAPEQLGSAGGARAGASVRAANMAAAQESAELVAAAIPAGGRRRSRRSDGRAGRVPSQPAEELRRPGSRERSGAVRCAYLASASGQLFSV